MSDLNTAEWLALAGLIRLMMDADGKVTIREHRTVATLAQRLGPKLWEAMAHAERDLDGEAGIRRQAERVVRPHAQVIIRDALEEMAQSDGIAEEEQALLDWIDALWAETPEP